MKEYVTHYDKILLLATLAWRESSRANPHALNWNQLPLKLRKDYIAGAERLITRLADHGYVICEAHLLNGRTN